MKKFWPLGVLLGGAVFAGARLILWNNSRASVRAAMSGPHDAAIQSLLQPKDLRVPNGIENTVNLAANQAGVHRLLSIGSVDSPDGPQLQIESEGTQASLLKLLSILERIRGLGACLRIHVMGATATSTSVRCSLLFSPSKPSPAVDDVDVAVSRLKRDVFIPLWRERAVSITDLALAQAKRMEEQQRKSEERAQTDQKNREAEERLNAKRRELIENYTLTGIGSSGHDPIAFVSQKSAGGAALMVHQQDLIGDARVIRIDEQKGEMQLDYEGKFQLLFRINSAPIGLQP